MIYTHTGKLFPIMLALLIMLNGITQTVHCQQKEQPDTTTTIAAAALGLLGLGGLGWYWLKSNAMAKKQQTQALEHKAESALFAALVVSRTTTAQDFMNLDAILKKQKININAQDKLGDLPLANAARVGNQEMVKFLLAHGADINGRDSKLETALTKAVENGDQAMVQLLLNHGAFVNLPNLLRKSPRSLAYEYKDKKVFALLEKQQEKFTTDLFDAARDGDIARVQHLLITVDINSTNDRGETALFEAVRHNHIPLVQYLIESGAKADHLNKRNETILFPAITATERESKQSTMLTYLIDNYFGVRQMINTKNVDGNTPLMYAVATRKPSAVAALLDAGARTNIVNESGYTVFDIAESPGTSKEEQTILTLLKPYQWEPPQEYLVRKK